MILTEMVSSCPYGNFENVAIGYGDKIDSTMYVMNVRGKNYVGVHGD